MTNDRLMIACEGFTAGIASLTRLNGEEVRRGGVVGCFSGLPFPPFNAVHAWTDQGDVAADVEALVHIGTEQGLPMAICVPVDSSHEQMVVSVGSELGFMSAGDPTTAMVLSATREVPPLQDGVTCVRARNAEDLAPIAELGIDVFGLPPAVARATIDPAVLGWDDMEWFTLWANGEAVACSMLFMADQVANVFNVAVPMAHRRRGLGAAATWEAVRRGWERGATAAALIASEMGEPVYTRMGFDPVGHVRTLIRA